MDPQSDTYSQQIAHLLRDAEQAMDDALVTHPPGEIDRSAHRVASFRVRAILAAIAIDSHRDEIEEILADLRAHDR